VSGREVRSEERRDVTFVVTGAGGLDVIGLEDLVTTGWVDRLVREREAAGTDVDLDTAVLLGGVEALTRD